METIFNPSSKSEAEMNVCGRRRGLGLWVWRGLRFYWNLTNSPPITPNGLFSMICEFFKILTVAR